MREAISPLHHTSSRRGSFLSAGTYLPFTELYNHHLIISAFLLFWELVTWLPYWLDCLTALLTWLPPVCISVNTTQDLAIREREPGCYSNSIVPPGVPGEDVLLNIKMQDLLPQRNKRRATCDSASNLIQIRVRLLCGWIYRFNPMLCPSSV